MSTVALLSHNGTVGAALFKHLLAAHTAKKLKLVVLHRESSDLSSVPKDAGVDTRVVDLAEGGLEVNKKALEGVEVVISPIGGPGIPTQTYLVDAIAQTPSVKTFFPSDFGTNWAASELTAPALKGLAAKEKIEEHAKEKGVAITNVRVGAFDKYFFAFGLGGVNVKANTVSAFRKSLQSPVRITSLDYLGYAVSYLLSTTSPSSLANKTYQIYDLAPTGQEFVDVLTKVHGTPTTVTQWSEEEFETALNLLSPAAIGAAVRRKWGDNDWGSAESDRLQVEGWEGKSLEEIVKFWINVQPPAKH